MTCFSSYLPPSRYLVIALCNRRLSRNETTVQYKTVYGRLEIRPETEELRKKGFYFIVLVPESNIAKLNVELNTCNTLAYSDRKRRVPKTHFSYCVSLSTCRKAPPPTSCSTGAYEHYHVQ